jgi:asparagine synthase (glutamine-hydrolysing)
MCRIVGIAFNHQHLNAINSMTDVLSHGGPDDRGVWVDQDAGVALGHRRLSIVDLSPLGHQPMVSASGRFVTVFNGEIYNFLLLRQELEALGCQFKGHSDTEVLLAAIETWGVDQSLQKFNGMFAFALWDRQERKLYLARDRFGEKPLYYGVVNGALIFASELKALKQFPGFNPSLNREALQLLVRYAYIQAPHSIYEGVFKLEPGHYIVVSENLALQSMPYWSAQSAILQAKANPYQGSFENAVIELDTILTQAVSLRMMSDVPLGAFLSGGVDSSTVVALMQKQSTQPVKTFSIGFEVDAYNEAPFAKAVANHLGTEHQELYVSQADLLHVIPKLPQLYCEPFADSSQIPTFLVSQLAKQKVTVALSGDAGDEIFGGYQRYFQFEKLRKLFSLPYSMRVVLAAGIRLLPAQGALKHKLTKLAQILHQNALGLYQTLISQNPQAESLCKTDAVRINFLSLHELTPVENLMFWDTISYLCGDILTKVDRASMAVALEVRVPLLDPNVFDFAWRLPEVYKVKSGCGKLVLKELLYRYVPKSLIDRPKAGFGIPIQDWLRGPLKEWAGNLLNEDNMRQQGYLDATLVQSFWQNYTKGKKNLGYSLWNILMFQAWLEQQ